MATVSPRRVRTEIARLVHRGLDLHDFSAASGDVLRRAVPFDGMCLVTIDPATLLPTGEVVVRNGLPSAATQRLTEIEVREADFTKFSALSRSKRPAASLSQATGGVLHRSLRHRELKHPHGYGDELRAALVDNSGTWGGLTLLHEAGRDAFTVADTRLVASVARDLAEGIQRAILLTALAGDQRPRSDDAPTIGLLLLADDNSIEVANPTAEMWLTELLAEARPGTRLPPAVNAVASRARAIAAGDSRDDDVARARVRLATGQWLLVRGSMLGAGPDARTAVILEPARSPELAPLIADAHGLTDRERAVTELVARGHPTSEIASRLEVSPYTVQDHLKAIFDKVGVSTRGELVARLFFDHYAPRLTTDTPLAPTGWFTQ